MPSRLRLPFARVNHGLMSESFADFLENGEVRNPRMGEPSCRSTHAPSQSACAQGRRQVSKHRLSDISLRTPPPIAEDDHAISCEESIPTASETIKCSASSLPLHGLMPPKSRHGRSGAHRLPIPSRRSPSPKPLSASISEAGDE